MQIFVPFANPKMSALILDDRRVVKMCLESAQIMSTAMHMRGVKGAPYKPTHENHPCVLWAAESSDNFWWLMEHWEYLCFEYWVRYGHFQGLRHKTEAYYKEFREAYDSMDSEPPTPFVNCTDLGLIDGCIHKTYCQYLVNKWDAQEKMSPAWCGYKHDKEIRDNRIWSNYKLAFPFKCGRHRRP